MNQQTSTDYFRPIFNRLFDCTKGERLHVRFSPDKIEVGSSHICCKFPEYGGKMPPSKKSSATGAASGKKKAAKAPATNPAAPAEASQPQPTQNQAQNQAQTVVPQKAVQPTTNTTNLSAEQHNSPAISEEAVRQRAYELYEQRGKRAGRHHEDWFRAEQEIRDRHRRNP